MARITMVLAALVASATGFVVPATRAGRSASNAKMGDFYGKNNTPAKVYPKGAFGGSEDAKTSGTDSQGWIGDRSKSLQVTAYQNGADFLFFQGPAPKTGVQEDLPSFFSPDNFADIQIKPIQIAVTATGIGTFAAAAAVIVQG